jgi:hypothetical protein
MAPPFLTSALDGGDWSASRPWDFTTAGTAPEALCMCRVLGSRVDLDVIDERKISYPYQELNPNSSTVQPAA